MKKAKSLRFLAMVVLAITFAACKKDNNSVSANNSASVDNSTSTVQPSFITDYLTLPASPFNYANQALPGYYTSQPVSGADNTPADNRVSDWGATLGRVLFYDKSLSNNFTISCSSCHQQAHGFADIIPKSKGLHGGFTDRNSMSLADARYYRNGHFFWDERANTLEDQVLMPIESDVEMGMNIDTAVTRLKAAPYYPYLFTQAFGDSIITSTRISEALAQFVRSIMSFSSKYDEGRAQVNNPNQPFPNFTAQENQGKQIFMSPQQGACAACHGTDAFIAPGPKNNGLDADNTADKGVGGITGRPNEEGKFKVPSLRNIALTAPYMHDGRFATLSEVIDHYSTGVKNNPNLDPPLKLPNGGVRNGNFTEAQKQALIAFLNTLTDYNLVSDEKFSDPFIHQ